MTPPTKVELSAKAQEVYAAMEYYRPASTVSSVASTLSSVFTAGYVTNPVGTYSNKAPKFDAIIKASNDTDRRAALKALREDKEAIASDRVSSLKVMLDILDHAFDADDGIYAEGTPDAVRQNLSPAEAAEEAIEKLIPSYQEQFVNAPNKTELLLMVNQTIAARLKIEKQQALAAAEEKLQALQAAHNEENVRKKVMLEHAKATAELEKKLAIDAANKATEAATDAQHIRAIETIEQLEAEHEANEQAAEKENDRIYQLMIKTQNGWDRESAKNRQEIHSLRATVASQQTAIDELSASANQAHAEVELNIEIIEAQQTSILTFAQEVAELTKQNQTLETEISNLRRRLENRDAAFGMRTEELRYTAAERDKLAKQLKQANTEKEEVLVRSQAAASTLKSRLAEQQASAQVLQQRLVLSKEAHADDALEISLLESQNAAATAQNEILSHEVTIHAGILALVKEQVEEQQYELEHRDFAQELKAEQAVSRATRNELSHAEAHMSHQDCELHSLKGALKKESELNKSLRREVVKLTSQLDDMRLKNSASAAASNSFHKKQPQQQQQQSQQQHQSKKFGKH
jgi:hypothetical protein